MKSNHKPFPIHMLSIGLLVLTVILSCNKDSDLLSEYVSSNHNNTSIVVVDDNFTILLGNNQTLDVLRNDAFPDDKVITITNVSNPANGHVSINKDNTLTYVAPDSFSSSSSDSSSDNSSADSSVNTSSLDSNSSNSTTTDSSSSTNATDSSTSNNSSDSSSSDSSSSNTSSDSSSSNSNSDDSSSSDSSTDSSSTDNSSSNTSSDSSSSNSNSDDNSSSDSSSDSSNSNSSADSSSSNSSSDSSSSNTSSDDNSSADSSTEIVDTFTYTTETEDDNGELVSNTGNVTVIVTTDPAPEANPLPNSVNSTTPIFTHQAKSVLKQRFENGYVAGAGFNDDITKVISYSNTFMANPSQYRPVFGDTNTEIIRQGHNLHTTAVYAYAIDDISIANVVAAELLAIVNSNDLYTTYWNTSNTIRWDSTNDKLWLQSSKAKKMKDSYNFIKNLQTNLTSANKATLESWFQRFAELAFEGLKNRLDGAFFGTGWDANNFTNPYYTGNEHGYDRPIQDSNGNDLYIMCLAQDAYNNRNWDIIGFVHSWAVENNNLEKEEYTRNIFKVFLKYGVYSDGTIWEVARNSSSNNTVGINYGWVTTEAVIRMAHTDAMANHFPNDRLYDYKTTDGVLNGSTTISDTPYIGTSTTDGVTEKSLLTLIKGQSNYLRSEANGGWNDIRFYGTTPLNSIGTSQPSALCAMANLYYKNQDLKNLYTYNTSVGYPAKQSFGGGYMAGVWDMDSGAWGNLIFGSMWYGQENNFFN